MYGPSGKDYLRMGCVIAVLAGLLAVGVEHGVSCLWNHLVGWK